MIYFVIGSAASAALILGTYLGYGIGIREKQYRKPARDARGRFVKVN